MPGEPKTATVSLLNNTYQVDAALVGRRVELIFDPFDLNDVTVRYHGKTFAKAVPYLIGRHSHPKARPETPGQPPPATNIDYLNLIAADHHATTAAAINFHALATPTTLTDADADADADIDTGAGPVPDQPPLPDMPNPGTDTDGGHP